MGVLLSIINGAILVGVGVIIIKFRRDIKHWVGAFMWFENIFGRGSTYLFIILIGSAFIIFGFFWPFGVFDEFLRVE